QVELRQQLGDVRAKHVAAEQFAKLCVRDELDEAHCVAEALCLAIGGVWEGRDLDLAAVLLCLLARCILGVTEGCDLRVAEGGAWHHLVIAQLLGLRTSDGLCCHNTLDRKSTRLNSSHVSSSYAVFC